MSHGKFIHKRQVYFSYGVRLRDELKEHIIPTMHHLCRNGYGTLSEGVFYKNPNTSAHCMEIIDILGPDFASALKSIKVPYGFPTSKGVFEQCVAKYNELYG